MQFQSPLWMPRRGPGITNAARFAAVIGLGVVTAIPVSAQTAEWEPCPEGSSGSVAGDPTPFPGGMCQIDTSDAHDGSGLKLGRAFAVSADGTVVLGYSTFYNRDVFAFRLDLNAGELLDLSLQSNLPNGGGYQADSIVPNALSADGRFFVGYTKNYIPWFNVGTYHRAFRWDATNGEMIDMGTLSVDYSLGARRSSRATAVNADGRIVVGESTVDSGFFRWANPEENDEGVFFKYWHAFRWDEASGQMVDLGTLRGGNLGNSKAVAVSADGSVVIGKADIDPTYAIDYTPGDFDTPNEYGLVERAFRWDEASGKMMDLGTLREDNRGRSYAVGISADGAVIIGNADTDVWFRNELNSVYTVRHAFRWDGQMTDLGSLGETKNTSSTATAVSADGNVVVGRSRTDNGDLHAFRWINGSMVDLGTLSAGNASNSFANAVNADGSVVVGSAVKDMPDTDSGFEMRAFRWDADSGNMIDLGSLLADNSGWSRAYAVSADGSVVVGQSEAYHKDGYIAIHGRPFIWRTVMQDYENLLLSYGQLANDTELAVSQQQMAVDRLMAQGCFAAGGASCFGIGGDLTRTANSSETGDNTRGNGTVSLHFGHGLNDHLTLGGTVALGGTELGSNAFDMDRTAAVSLWADFSQGGAARTGLQMHAAVGWAEETGSVVRGRGLQGVTQAGGEANVITKAVEASVAYGIAQNSWLITPKLSVAHFRTSRSAHVDAGSDFDSRYDALSVSRTVARLSVTGERDLSDKDHLSLSAGVARDLDNDRVSLTGMSELANMDTLAIDSTLKRNEVRSFAEARYTHDLGRDRSVTGSLRVGEALYGDVPQVGLGIMYNVAF